MENLKSSASILVGLLKNEDVECILAIYGLTIRPLARPEEATHV